MALAKLALILALGVWGSPDHAGFAVRYAPGRMEHMAAVRHAPSAPCYVAYTSARDADMGRLWLRIEGPAGTIVCLVVDLPQPRDRQGLIGRRVWVELGYPERWICGEGWQGKAAECEVRVWVSRE